MDRHALDQLPDDLRGFGADALVIERVAQGAHLVLEAREQHRVGQDIGR
ncbi:hypothetical protein [Sphingomonas sp. C3-2]|nr:hypothetical protein [Sphingomonas sp. C3-2]WOK35446.1 hypothetical protein QYC26_10495 [Sphingomonas sp. C3-2]